MTMIEIMADAMAADTDSEQAFMRGDNSDGWRFLAIAALKAMRVPTEAMVEAGAKAAWQTGTDWDSRDTWEAVPDYAKEYWRDKFRCAHIAMIDAVIEGREG